MKRETSERSSWTAIAALCVASLTWAAPGSAEQATVLTFEERETGAERSVTRLIVTERYLRIDDGQAAQDFLLFDRKDKTIYSVSALDRSILIIKRAAPPARPAVTLKDEVVEEPDRVPPIDGRKVRHYRLLTNGKLCYDLYAAEGLAPQAVAAWREYRESLASEQARTLAWTPPEMQTPCMLANNVYTPARFLAHGLPVRYVDAAGKLGELVDYQQNAPIEATLFDLPAAFPHVAIEELRRRR